MGGVRRAYALNGSRTVFFCVNARRQRHVAEPRNLLDVVGRWVEDEFFGAYVGERLDGDLHRPAS